MTGDVTPDPVTEATAALDRLLADTGDTDFLDRLLAESARDVDALNRFLAETAAPPLDLGDLPPLDLADVPDLTTARDLVDLDRLLAETTAPLQDATVVGLVAEVLGRDGV